MHLGQPWLYGQHQQIDDVASVLRTFPGTVILAGDLDAARWSVAASRTADAGELTSVPPVEPTWMHPNRLRPCIGFPIDHVFFKGNIVILSAKVQKEVDQSICRSS
jgi:endonuclease/exonuclease/phosphatase (EEP) superfamily protein YafD